MKKAVLILLVLLVAFAGLQLVRPEIGTPPVTADLQAPPEVRQILQNSCYNCHSNETKLWWYDKVAPAYWVVAHDVKEGRAHLNFSDIGAKTAAEQKATLYEAVNQIQFGAMPLPSYKRVHPSAAVTPEQMAVLRAYLNPSTPITAPSAADVTAADAQYAKWIVVGTRLSQAPAALNGIAFPSDYKNWKVVSSTDRFDNQTIRAVLGNDIAVKAVAENHVNPWPDGATLAKVAWAQKTGAFLQVEFMIKDAKKYASTLGWGFARWRGADLKPYGKDAQFVNECVGCHTPLRPNDYVFTLAIPTVNQSAALMGDLPSNPLHWKVITSGLNRQDSTMSTLFGNDMAVDSARSSAQHDYPAGSVLSLVTWTQQEDPHWFGARIPAAPKSVEFVTVTVDADHHPLYAYQDFEGAPLNKTSDQRSAMPNERAAVLLAQRAAVMP